MSDAHELLQGVRDLGYEPIALSGVPNSNIERATEQQKMMALRQHFTDLEGIFCLSRQKWVYCLPGDVIIDDWPQYEPLWTQAGGKFIVHTCAHDSLNQLKRHLLQENNCHGHE